MADTELLERLKSLSSLSELPESELEWIVAHGEFEVHSTGAIMAPLGKRIEKLWIILSGHIGVRVDRGLGPRRVMEWRAGQVSGMLPYSRMKGPPGHNYFESPSELLTVHERYFPEMIHHCPMFTAYTVHLMLDRARSFNTSDLQDEKMISLGKLAAGLAHELNNPASAAVRGAKLLQEGLAEADAASRALGAAGLTQDQIQSLEQLRTTCLAKPSGTVLSALQQADREDHLAEWLEEHQVDPAHAAPLAETSVTLNALEELARTTRGDTLALALRWIAAGCTTHTLAGDLEQAATRIHELVGAVKQFTYMDNRAGPELVDVETGLRDTIRVVASKARAKGAAVTLDCEPDLPQVVATGAELNQVWMNLIDNALDAIGQSGQVEITARARRDLKRVVVRVVDDGPGIPKETQAKIFDAFFTTKPPGEGTGLGLEIARRLVRLHQGDIEVESEPGRTEFRVSLQLPD